MGEINKYCPDLIELNLSKNNLTKDDVIHLLELILKAPKQQCNKFVFNFSREPN